MMQQQQQPSPPSKRAGRPPLLVAAIVATLVVLSLVGEEIQFLHPLHHLTRELSVASSSSSSSFYQWNVTTTTTLSNATALSMVVMTRNASQESVAAADVMIHHPKFHNTLTSEEATVNSASQSGSSYNDSAASSNDVNNRRPPLPKTDVTLVVGLSGEFGNHLHKFARAYGITQWAQDEYNLTMKWLLKQQIRRHSPYKIIRKALSTQRHLQQCFDFVRPLDFALGNELLEDGGVFYNQSEDYFVRPNNISLEGGDSEDLRSNLDKLSNYRTTGYGHHSLAVTQPSNNGTYNAATHGLPPTLVESSSFQHQFLVDRYYDLMRTFFVFNDTAASACCQQRPDPDESVFHYRGFSTEMPKVYRTMGFQELSPYRIAHDLFGHLNEGDKIAIVGRFVNQESSSSSNAAGSNNTSTTYQIVDALQSRGLQVRVITGGDAMQDFCFLKSAQKELVGMIRSTYAEWAFLLGNATMTRFYVVDSPLMRKAHGSDDLLRLLSYNWTHPALQGRYQVEVYESDEEGRRGR